MVPYFPLDETQAHWRDVAAQLAERFAPRAAEHDRAGTFPYENFQDLVAAGYQTLVVPREFGGVGADLLTVVLAQDSLARGDGATALGIDMHLHVLGQAAETRAWPAPLFERVCRAAVEEGALINSLATEPELGSPSRGGLPKTMARRVSSGWRLSGRKTFATMSPVLRFFIVSATLEGTESVGNFLVERGPGVIILETWDALGMRASGSHDLVLEEAWVPEDGLIAMRDTRPGRPAATAWFALSIAAVYLGVAGAARDAAVRYALERVPTALGRPIATLESIQRRLGLLELDLIAARALLWRVAETWSRYPELRERLGAEVAAAKHLATNNAVAVTDQALRVVGGAGLTPDLPLERYFRDVRAGLTHPPNEDAALTALGRAATSGG